MYWSWPEIRLVVVQSKPCRTLYILPTASTHNQLLSTYGHQRIAAAYSRHLMASYAISVLCTVHVELIWRKPLEMTFFLHGLKRLRLWAWPSLLAELRFQLRRAKLAVSCRERERWIRQVQISGSLDAASMKSATISVLAKRLVRLCQSDISSYINTWLL